MSSDLRAALAHIPALDRFPTVDEMQAELDRLAQRYPDLVRVRRIGTSRLGEPIRMATVGDGECDALVFGGPHANEPVGFLAVRELAWLLCAEDRLRERLGFRWHLVPCVDPDAARLNESWYVRPDGRERYLRGFYRPATAEQVEWTFPHLREPGYFDRMLPETVALARVIDEVRPEVQCALHNSEYGGVFHYTTSDDPELADRLAEAADWAGLPLHNAVFQAPTGAIRPGVLRMPTAAELASAAGAAVAATGASSGEYARRHGTVTVVTETPLWPDPRAASTGASGRSYADVVADSLHILDLSIHHLGHVLALADDDLRLDTPFRRSLSDMRRTADAVIAGWGVIAEASASRRPASVAEESSFEGLPHTLRLRAVATALRMLDAETACGNVRDGIRRARAEAEQLFHAWLRDAEVVLPDKPVDVRPAVVAQVATILAAAEHVGRRSAPPPVVIATAPARQTRLVKAAS
ncbi:M14 family zinc carboxypeptidase [Pseudonocardia thermophila]|jgi:Zinc carboxypeptidase.|uniref:M14 family zinc carboxypeptidase n=1 Tax=Pseudonocardia thermophila TaxID=1848 RepID=UPI00248E3833|nr:M14 family zinc carboxypeptidase [Pseudonocardia thermophila]